MGAASRASSAALRSVATADGKEVSSVEGRDYKRLPLPKATTMIALFPAPAVERAADLVDRRSHPVEGFSMAAIALAGRRRRRCHSASSVQSAW